MTGVLCEFQLSWAVTTKVFNEILIFVLKIHQGVVIMCIKVLVSSYSDFYDSAV